MAKTSDLKIIQEVTPKKMRCAVGPCPAVFKTNKKSYLIIGKKLDANKLGIEHRLNKDEVLIEVPNQIIDEKE